MVKCFRIIIVSVIICMLFGMVTEKSSYAKTPKVTKIKVVGASKLVSMSKNTKKIFKVKITAKKNKYKKFKVKSSNKNVATVHKTKKTIIIYARRKGTTKITVVASYNKKKKQTIKLIVKDLINNNGDSDKSNVHPNDNSDPYHKMTQREEIKTIIDKFNTKGASIPTDLSDNRYYGWEGDSLIEVNWINCDIVGDLDFSNFDKLKKINLKSNNSLYKLNAVGTQLESLAVNGCGNLEILYLGMTPISNIDLSDNRNLRILSAFSTNCKTLNLKSNVNLKELYLNGSSISQIDLSNNKKLTVLYLQYAKSISALDVSYCPDLNILRIEGTGINTINVSNNMGLESLYCNNSTSVIGDNSNLYIYRE